MFLKTKGLMVPQWIRIFVLTQLIAAAIAQSGCIRCEDFNRIPSKSCAQDYKQCGDCLTGFIEDTEDPRLCYALEILTDANEDLTKEFQSEVYLICKFNALVSCKWSKDGEEVKDIGPKSNRKWSTGNGENTEDCSLNIGELRDEDVGSWVCSNMADSNVNQISGHPIQVNIQAKLKESPEASYVVEEGDSKTIPCKFDHPVSCSWKRNGSPVSSSGNYQFAASAADCSLTIAKASLDEDGVNWKCSEKGDPSRNGVSAESTTLEVKKKRKAKATRALYVADQNAKVSPLIYYGSEVVNGATLMYPGDEAMAELLRLQCQLPGARPSGHRLWWVLHDDREYQEQSNGPLNVGIELGTAIVQRLKSLDKIELICMAEDGLKQVSTANVFFIAGVSQSDVVTAAASSFDTIIIVLFVFIAVIVLALIGTIATLIWALRNKKVNGNVKVNDVMEANDDVEANKPPEGCQRSDSTISTESASSTTRLLKKT